MAEVDLDSLFRQDGTLRTLIPPDMIAKIHIDKPIDSANDPRNAYLEKERMKKMGNKKKPLKLFISMPMSGRTDEEIQNDRNTIMDNFALAFPYNEFEILANFDPNMYEVRNEMWNLGRCLQLMSEADVLYFATGWENSRGCRMEHQIALEYNTGLIIDPSILNSIIVCE